MRWAVGCWPGGAGVLKGNLYDLGMHIAMDSIRAENVILEG